MNHKEIRVELAQRIASLLEAEGRLPISLRPYQQETLLATRKWLENPEGSRRGHVAHATGLGKTMVFATMVGFSTGLRSLIIVPSKVLVEQTARVIVQMIGGVIGHVSSLGSIRNHNGEVIAVHGHQHQDVVITTVDSFQRHGAKLAAEFAPHLIIQDECHWAYTTKAQRAFEYFSEAVVIGFSATPDYLTTVAKGGTTPVTLGNGQTLYGPRDQFAETHFGTKLDERTVQWGIENGWLAPLAWGHIEFEASLDTVPVIQGPAGLDYSPDALHALMADHWSVMTETVARLYQDTAYDLMHRQSFAICPSVKAAHDLANVLASVGVTTACVTGDTPDDERYRILTAYKANEIRFLSSVMVLREGWDAPNAEVCLMLRPTKSRVLYQQCMGRVLRPAPDGTHKVALVLDAHFRKTRVAPLSAPVLFAKPGDEVPERGILVGPRKTADGPVHTMPTPVESPYLPKGAKPKLVIVNQYEIEHWAGPDGTFEADGEAWALLIALCKTFNVKEGLLNIWLRDVSVRSRIGKDLHGKTRTFYAIADVKNVVQTQEELSVQANTDGTFNVDEEIFGVRGALARRLGISSTTLALRIQDADGLTLKQGRDETGNKRTLYALSEIRRLVTDLLDLPRARDDDFFEKDGEEWGTIPALVDRLGVMYNTVRHRVSNSAVVRSCQGITKAGSPLTFYSSADAEKVCANLLADVPTTDKLGILKDGKEIWGYPKGLAPLLGVSDTAVRNCIQQHPNKVRVRPARDLGGRIREIYALSDIKKIRSL